MNVSAVQDFSEIDATVSDPVFGTPKEIIDAILNNELSLDGTSLFDNLIKLMGISIKNIIPSITSLFAITLIISAIEKLKLINQSTENACLAGGRIIFSVILISSCNAFIKSAGESLENISLFADALLPILITLLASLGAQGTVSAMGSSQVLLSTVLINISRNVILPLILSGLTVSAINGILADNKLKGIADFLKNASSWIMGAIFTVFSAILTVQGLVSGVSDGISIRSIKYALSSSVPIIGSNISDSFSSVLLSAFSIKSAAGIMGIIIIIGIVIIPILNLWIYRFCLNCFGAVVAPFAGNFVVEQIRNVSDFLKLVLAVLLGVSVLWFIYLGVLVSVGGNLI